MLSENRRDPVLKFYVALLSDYLPCANNILETPNGPLSDCMVEFAVPESLAAEWEFLFIPEKDNDEIRGPGHTLAMLNMVATRRFQRRLEGYFPPERVELFLTAARRLAEELGVTLGNNHEEPTHIFATYEQRIKAEKRKLPPETPRAALADFTGFRKARKEAFHAARARTMPPVPDTLTEKKSSLQQAPWQADVIAKKILRTWRKTRAQLQTRVHPKPPGPPGALITNKKLQIHRAIRDHRRFSAGRKAFFITSAKIEKQAALKEQPSSAPAQAAQEQPTGRGNVIHLVRGGGPYP